MDLMADLERNVLGVGIGAARAVPMTWFVPAFGGPHAPGAVRVGLGVLLATLCSPRLSGLGALAASPALVVTVVREVAVGLTLGLVVALAFKAAEAAGRLTDTLRGSNLAEVLSPLYDARTSPLGDVYLLLAVITFFEIDGLRHVTTALARSYDAIPIAPEATAARLGNVATVVVAASARLLESALGLAAPAIVAFLLADIVLGVVGRAAPQIPLFFLGMPLKALLGVGIVLLSIGALHGALASGFEGWAPFLEQAMRAWR